MLKMLLRTVLWRGASRLIGGRATRNARMAQRALRMAKRFRR